MKFFLQKDIVNENELEALKNDIDEDFESLDDSEQADVHQEAREFIAKNLARHISDNCSYVKRCIRGKVR